MKKTLNIQKIALAVVTVGTIGLFNTGCSVLGEMAASQTEIPSVENQVNRAAIGMAIVRENHIIVNKIPISADAQWPTLLGMDINASSKEFINDALAYDPYYATKHYTEAALRKALGSGALMSMLGDNANLISSILDQTVTPLVYRTVTKIDVLFANPDLQPRESYATREEYIKARTQNWPDFFDFEASPNHFLEFKHGKLREIESASGDYFPTISSAIIALAPTNMQKELELADSEMIEAFDSVARAQADKGEQEAILERDKGEKQAKVKTANYIPLTQDEINSAQEEIKVLNAQIKEFETIAEEKEKIYFKLLDEMVVALDSDMNIDDENYVKLAKNLHLVAEEIQVSSKEAYAAFGLAVTNLIANNAILKFPTELATLLGAQGMVPVQKQALYGKRLQRLGVNALAALPNALMGTYYASKQSDVAGKYEDVTEKIIKAYEVKMKQELAAQAEAEKEEAARELTLEEKAEAAQEKLQEDTK